MKRNSTKQVSKPWQMVRKFRAGIVIVLIVAAAGIVVWLNRTESTDRLLQSSELLFRRGQISEADRRLDVVLDRRPNDLRAIELKSRILIQNGESRKAADLLSLPGDGDNELRVGQLRTAAKLYEDLGALEESERLWKRVLIQSKVDPEANRELAKVLTIQSRRWEASNYLQTLLDTNHASLEDLVLLANREPFIDDRTYIDRMERANPSTRCFLLTKSRIASQTNQPDQAKRLIEQFLLAFPDSLDGIMERGKMIVNERGFNELNDWYAKLPASALEHPDVWFVLGDAISNRDQPELAWNCWARGLYLDPSNAAAAYAISQVQSSGISQDRRAFFGEHATRLRDLASALSRIFPRRNSASGLLELRGDFLTIIERLVQLGRTKETLAWKRVAVGLGINEASGIVVPEADADRLAHWKSEIDALTTIERQELISRVREVLRDSVTPGEMSGGLEKLQFVDVASEVGLDFQFDNGKRGQNIGTPIAQTTGGGIAVLDFDRDGWSDLFFTQGGVPGNLEAGTSSRSDSLFRNINAVRAQNVSSVALPSDRGYGQGVAAGDLDNDGFTDLYIANQGFNQLLHNNGDGTFSDWSHQMGTPNARWTTSCAMADLNHDAIADLVDVTYVDASDVDTRLCRVDGPPRTCQPTAFEAARDRVWLGEGSGGLRPLEDFDSNSSRGYGLGLLGFRNSENKVNLFVANDETANFLFCEKAGAGQSTFQLEDIALLSGVAYDRHGRSQACMGIAADDVNGDGRLDMLVSNYYMETNTLYLGRGDTFTDATANSGLGEPSRAMLGFGAQFLDADLDGWPDLVVTNGHVDDYSYKNVPYRMRTQLFRNLGMGRFAEHTFEPSDTVFGEARLGRSLAKLDWNNDGLEDFVISNLDSPAILALNRTETNSERIMIELVGTESQRDALTATVQCQIGSRLITKHLTFGNGYQASNDRRVVIGCGSGSSIVELSVQWPNGKLQSFGPLPVNRGYRLVEYRSEAEVFPIGTDPKTNGSQTSN